MGPELDPPSAATCTSCLFKEDKSNYWTAVLYFKHPNGSFIRVPQIANHFTGNPNGGITVYYIQPADGGPVTAFPKVCMASSTFLLMNNYVLLLGIPNDYRKCTVPKTNVRRHWSQVMGAYL